MFYSSCYKRRDPVYIVYSSCNLNDNTLQEHVNECLSRSVIEVLNISDNPISSEGLITFLNLFKVVSIKHLNISFLQVDDRIIDYLLNSNNIDSVDIAGNEGLSQEKKKELLMGNTMNVYTGNIEEDLDNVCFSLRNN